MATTEIISSIIPSLEYVDFEFSLKKMSRGILIAIEKALMFLFIEIPVKFTISSLKKDTIVYEDSIINENAKTLATKNIADLIFDKEFTKQINEINAIKIFDELIKASLKFELMVIEIDSRIKPNVKIIIKGLLIKNLFFE